MPVVEISISDRRYCLRLPAANLGESTLRSRSASSAEQGGFWQAATLEVFTVARRAERRWRQLQDWEVDKKGKSSRNVIEPAQNFPRPRGGLSP